MKKWMIVSIAVLGAIALGVGGAYAFNKAYPVATANNNLQKSARGRFFGPMMNNGFWNQGQGDSTQRQKNPQSDQGSPSGPGFNSNTNKDGQFGRGMMGNGQFKNGSSNNQSTNSERITLDDAVTQVNAYLQKLDTSLKVSEVMEFENNFYVVVSESSSGRGAMELLVDPYSGAVSPEMGANRMWNLKYGSGMMMSSSASDSTLTEDLAITRAKEALTAQNPNATLNEDGISFYGYYTFDYSVDGKIAGMLSVNGLIGKVLFHTWHGAFINEKEF
jgi:hypothetical protein